MDRGVRFLVPSDQRTAGGVVLAALWLAGCAATPEPASDEPSLAAQVAAVAAGQTDRIQIESQPLRDADLAALSALAGLRELLIDHPQSPISAAGLESLVKLPGLEHLRIRGGPIDDAALAAAARIASLKILNLPRATVTDAGLACLQQLPRLELLRLGSSRLSDAGMETIAALPALRQLHLIEVPITDAGLRTLARMERLESLYIDGGAISDAGWEELFQARPRLHVHLNQQHHDRDPHRHAH